MTKGKTHGHLQFLTMMYSLEFSCCVMDWLLVKGFEVLARFFVWYTDAIMVANGFFRLANKALYRAAPTFAGGLFD